jgi:hypothetical protein
LSISQLQHIQELYLQDVCSVPQYHPYRHNAYFPYITDLAGGHQALKRRPRFDSRPVQAGFVVENMALGQILLQVLQFSIRITPTVLHTISSHLMLTSCSEKCKVCKSMHHRTIQINHQPDATIFQFIILMFIYSSTCFGHSPAQWLQWQPLVLPLYHGDSRAVFVVGPASRPDQLW